MLAHIFDNRLAWTGSHSHAPEVPLRVEAASWKGHVASFEVTGPWSGLSPARTLQARAAFWLYVGVVSCLFAVAALLAWRNFHLGRSDVRGARRLGIFALSCEVLQWFLRAKHHAEPGEYILIVLALGRALFSACAYGVLYIALEPYVRRRLPQSLISWTRLLAGGVRDPLVAGHALIGVLTGVIFAIVFGVENLLLEPYGSTQLGAVGLSLVWLLDAPRIAGLMLNLAQFSIGMGLCLLLLLFLFRVVFRREWLGGIAALLLSSLLFVLMTANFALGGGFIMLATGSLVFVGIRLGVLPMIVSLFVSGFLCTCPITTDFSSWYAGRTIAAISLAILLAAYCFYVSLAGRKIFGDAFLDR